jgi:hypothetical protein
LTTKELTSIVTANSLAIAENTKAIAELTNGILSLHGSIKSLETIAESLLESANKHEAVIARLEKQWEAYLNRQPSN